jgi:hypothetical protein
MSPYFKNILFLIVTIVTLPVFADYTDVPNTPDQGELSGFAIPPATMEGDQPLPLQATGNYPAGTQPAQDIPIPGEMPVAEVPLPALQVHLDLNFTQTMGDEVVLMYEYFYSDARRIPWEGQITFANNSIDQTVEIPRSSAVRQMLLFLRPSGFAGVQCIPGTGQNPVISNNVTKVQIIGTTDADGNYLCQMIFG